MKPCWRNLQMSLANYGKYICNIFGRDTVKIGVIGVKFQFGQWISKDGLMKNFFCMHGGRKLVVVEI